MISRLMAMLCMTAITFSVFAAQAAEGWYISARGFATVLGDATNEGNQGRQGIPFAPSVSFPVTTRSHFETGFGVAGLVGYGFGNLAGGGILGGGVRLEGEIAYRENDLDRLTIRDEALGTGDVLTRMLPDMTVPTGGDVSSTSFMISGFYDFGGTSPVSPYLGAGVGMARISMNNVDGSVGVTTTLHPPEANHSISRGLTIDGSDDSILAYQLGAGVGYDISATATLTVDYRYFVASDIKFTDAFGETVNAEYHSHDFSIGLRYHF